ncbi:MAG: UDP-N-acetylmuramoyl-L-alanine--D-glutamate ligase [Phycisphaerales bacterium]|nr:UDP-N-acetylmuramoyl-L-alanine--D-glutamate ligase [Phycisphaerales bacterium]
MELAGKRVTVMGLGRFGGGAGVTRWLVDQGADVLLTDLEPAQGLTESIDKIKDLIDCGAVTLRLGGHNVSDFTKCDAVVANPAVPKPWDNRFLRSAQAAAVPITTEIRLLTERIDRQRVIGVTGSAGKSTTSAMIHHIMTKAGHRSHLGGNIGGSLLNDLPQIKAGDWITLELSSAMLYWLGPGIGRTEAAGWSPHIAVLTNIEPNHFDWHGSFEHYRDCKLGIFAQQQPDDSRITVDAIGDQARIVDLRLPGKHNQANAQLAIAATERGAGIEQRQAASFLEDFAGLPHRLQFVGEHDGLLFYNDSKSTTPQAALLAVAAFSDASKVHLIAGGYDKGSDLTPIAALAPRLGGLYTIGATGPRLADGAPSGSFAENCQTLDAAVGRAINRMHAGDILVLSPGCASWDQFTNYEERGEAFSRLVCDTTGASLSER